MMRAAVLLGVVALAAPAEAKPSEWFATSTAIAKRLGDAISVRGLAFADPDCQAKFGKPTVVWKDTRDEFAACLAQLQLTLAGTAFRAEAGNGSAGDAHVEIELGFDGRRISSILPVDASDTDAALPTITSTFAEPTLPGVSAAALANVTARPRVKTCFDATAKLASSRLVTSSGVAEIDAVLVGYFSQHPLAQPITIGGTAIAACTIVSFANVSPPDPHADAFLAMSQLDKVRTAGTLSIAPERSRLAALTPGHHSIFAEVEVCLGVDGAMTSVTILGSAGLPGYDEQLDTTIRTTWKFDPWRVDGKPRAVCAQQTYWYAVP